MSTSLPPIRVSNHYVDSDPSIQGGSPLIQGTRVPVRRLWAWHRKGVTVETLIKRYPALGPAKVLGAIAFAYENQDLMAADLAREQAEIDAASEVPGEMIQQRIPNT